MNNPPIWLPTLKWFIFIILKHLEVMLQFKSWRLGSDRMSMVLQVHQSLSCLVFINRLFIYEQMFLSNFNHRHLSKKQNEWKLEALNFILSVLLIIIKAIIIEELTFNQLFKAFLKVNLVLFILHYCRLILV